MKRSVLLAALVISSSSAAIVNLSIRRFPQESLSNGTNVPARLQGATGASVNVSGTSRQLMWVERTEALKEPLRSDKGIVGDNLAITVKFGRNLVVFYERQSIGLPSRKDREGIAARYAGAQVLYDERGVMKAPGDWLDMFMEGLYLLDGRAIKCRYVARSNEVWKTQNIQKLIQQQASLFMKTGRVTMCPEPARTTGAKVRTTGLPGNGKVRVLLRIRGIEADAPANSLTIDLKEQPDGSTLQVYKGKTPASEYRYRLDVLTPILKKAGAVPIALVSQPTADLAKLRKTFPDWTFLPPTPENLLRWLELQGAVLAPDGTVRLPFLPTGNEYAEGLDMLQNALKP